MRGVLHSFGEGWGRSFWVARPLRIRRAAELELKRRAFGYGLVRQPGAVVRPAVEQQLLHVWHRSLRPLADYLQLLAAFQPDGNGREERTVKREPSDSGNNRVKT